jgi:hypothetical protein
MFISYCYTLANEGEPSLYTPFDSLLQDHERCAPNEVCIHVCVCVCVCVRVCVCVLCTHVCACV